MISLLSFLVDVHCALAGRAGQLTVLSPATVPYCRRMFPLMQMLQPFSASPSMVNFGCHAATKPLVMNNFDANSAIKQGLLFSWLDLDPCVIDGDYFNVPDNLMSEWLNISVYFVQLINVVDDFWKKWKLLSNQFLPPSQTS
ncbi:hypothetical protein Peur_070411 [Populus x canadensis]|uniref:Uncharacterized protein n=1 Tax=Populus deltoides TaxID=3696 RepID=A0A8T2X236_POPDE|nr:hypothetical protein H0E87_027511 [Populus deltoides]